MCKLCAKINRLGICASVVQRFWPAVARGWPVARPDHPPGGKAASGNKIAPAIVLRLSAALVTHQRGLD